MDELHYHWFELMLHIIIITLLLWIILKPKNECKCASNKRKSKAPFHSLRNPVQMNMYDTTEEEQTRLNVMGCIEQGGIWKTNPDRCETYNKYGTAMW